MNSPTELADRLSFVFDQLKRESEPCEFTGDDEKRVTNAITTFIANLNQCPNDYELTQSDIVHGLALNVHPEGGFYRRFSWTKEKSQTFYLLPVGSVSSWHRLKGTTETLKWLCGGQLAIPQISSDCRWLGEVELAKDKGVVVSEVRDEWSDWFGAYHTDDNYCFVMCECTPPFEFSKFELANEGDVIRFRAAIGSDRVNVIVSTDCGNGLQH